MKENGAKKESTENQHPVHKSLSVFPILTESSNGILANSSSNVLTKGKKLKRKKRKGSHNNSAKFNVKSKGSIHIPTDSMCNTFETDRDELLYVKHVREKLDRVSDLLPVGNSDKKIGNRSPIHLPPISTPMQITPHTSGLFEDNNNKNDWKSDYHRAFSLPVIPQIEKNPCTCKKSSSFKGMDKVVKKCNAKEFRAEETPPLFSVHVRWKNQRNGKSEYCQETLREVFGYFGAVSKIILKSKSSAVVVFHHIESAANADKVMQTMGKEMKMHVRWLNELKKNNNSNSNSSN